MYKVGEKIIYKKDVCIVKEIKNNYLNNEDYYILTPISDSSLKIEIPVSNKAGFFRNIITIEELKKIINSIPNVDIITSNDKLIEYEYKNLMATGTHENLIKIIKTTYQRNKERLDNKKKVSDKDSTYFKQAEKYLYNEFSVVLNMTYDETKQYVINRVNELVK